TKNPSSGTFAMPGVPKAAAPPPEPTERHVAAEHDEAEPAESEDGHPVGRWLQKLIGFKKSAPPTLRKPQAEPPAPPAATTAARPPALHPPGTRPTPRVEAAALEPAPLPSP